MTTNKSKGTPLQVFSGKEEALNRLILLTLQVSKQPLIKYDLALLVERVKGFRHTDKKTVYDRVDKLHEQRFIDIVGQRPTKPGWPSDLYAINRRGLTALDLDKNSINDFLLNADDEQLRKLSELISVTKTGLG
jgi:hypothetical protein